MSTQIDDLAVPNISRYRIAVILPCYNEEHAITQVIAEFSAALPNASIYVFDNNSSDNSASLARKAGAVVFNVNAVGKGNVVRRMFADIEADIYVMADSDLTYDASASVEMVDLLVKRNLDMVVGSRVDEKEEGIYRPGHRIGNFLLTYAVRSIFGGKFQDMLSGYRVFSRRFVKSFPALSIGFETETELTIHALELRMPVAELQTRYRARPPGSISKLSTYKDGMRILKTLARLYMVEHPLAFYSVVAVLFLATGIILSVPLFIEYFETGLVPRFPTAILIIGLVLSGMLSFACGLIVDTVSRGRHETRRLAYLAIPSLRME